MNDKIKSYLINAGYSICTSFYPIIDNCINWWKGKNDFHKYTVVYDDKTYSEEMYSLNMASRIASDWASICWSEKDEVETTDQNQNYLNDKLAELKFDKVLPSAIEKSAYSGTCAAILRVKNAKLLEDDNRIITDKFTKYDLILMRANQIIPLRVEHGNIIDCAFVSDSMIGDKKVYYIEIHELVKRKDKDTGEVYESYRIKNVYIDEGGKEVENEKILKEYYTNSDIPLFSILEPPMDNPYEEANGLGFPIYGNAIDQLKAVDIAYHNFVMDYYLGGKKIFYNKKLCREDGEGNVIYPTQVAKQQFQIVGDTYENANENSLIKEYNPDLRITDNEDGLQFFLDLLSFECHLGTKYYQFDTNEGVTATEYKGEKQDLFKNAKKYRENVDAFIENICRGILLLGRLMFGENVNENDKIEVVNSDGFLVSTEDLKDQYMEEIAAGLRSKTSYLMKFYGMSEEEAKKELELINEEETNSFDLSNEEGD